MPTSFSHIDLCLVSFPLPLLQSLQNQYCYFCHSYRYFHITLLLSTLLQILSYPAVVELTTQLLILENILWLPLCRINKFGLNTLPSKTVAIPYTCGLSIMWFNVTKFVWCPEWDHGHDEESQNGRDIKIDLLDHFYSDTGSVPASFG